MHPGGNDLMKSHVNDFFKCVDDAQRAIQF